MLIDFTGESAVFGFSVVNALIVGAAMMFSSTIVGIKLLPAKVLHHRHIGEVMISVLLLQDMLAIIVLLVLHSAKIGAVSLPEVMMTIGALPVMFLLAYLI